MQTKQNIALCAVTCRNYSRYGLPSYLRGICFTKFQYITYTVSMYYYTDVYLRLILHNILTWLSVFI